MITVFETREQIDAEDDELLRRIAFNQATNYQYASSRLQAKPVARTLPCVCKCSRDKHKGGCGGCSDCHCAKYKTTGEIRLKKLQPPEPKPCEPCEVEHIHWWKWKTVVDTDERRSVDVRWRYGLCCDVPTQESEEELIAKLIEDEPLDLCLIDGDNYAGLPGFQGSRFKKHRVSC
jgi:hypothetical protein